MNVWTVKSIVDTLGNDRPCYPGYGSQDAARYGSSFLWIRVGSSNKLLSRKKAGNNMHEAVIRTHRTDECLRSRVFSALIPEVDSRKSTP